MAGCRVQQTCRVSSGVNRRSRCNGKGGTSSERGSSEPKGGLRPTREWTHDICTGGGAIFDEPQERSPDWRRRIFGPTADRTDRANRQESLKKRTSSRFDPHRNAGSIAARANQPRCRRRRRRRASASAVAVKSSASLAGPTSGEAVGSRKGEDTDCSLRAQFGLVSPLCPGRSDKNFRAGRSRSFP
jgi:hypothetical protein